MYKKIIFLIISAILGQIIWIDIQNRIIRVEDYLNYKPQQVLFASNNNESSSLIIKTFHSTNIAEMNKDLEVYQLNLKNKTMRDSSWIQIIDF